VVGLLGREWEEEKEFGEARVWFLFHLYPSVTIDLHSLLNRILQLLSLKRSLNFFSFNTYTTACAFGL